ncbi:NAD-dependent epimerase/dehydratase family protein [Candidatus Omnitrophota bacterium]
MILVTGATGYIGSRLVKKLLDDSRNVRALVIKNDPLLKTLKNLNCEIAEGDITDKDSLVSCMKDIKTVFHLAAVLVSNDKGIFHKINYEGAKNVVDTAVAAGVEHFAYLSAVAAGYRVRTTYGESKLKSETLMKKAGNTKFTIVRPTLLYGAAGSQELKLYVESLRKFPIIVPVIGGGRAVKRPVALDDIVKGLALLVNNHATYGKTYNFGGGTEISMWNYTKLICDTFGIKKPLVPIPAFLSYAIAAIFFKVSKNPFITRDRVLGVTMDANFDYQQAREDLGYDPVSVYEGYEKAFSRQEEML